ncbi:MAG: Unknown protein [uncultured Thiotrichaceae bacterium]|uniref:PcfJ-like protein n=1 Tax=uncultured Thiotrichaceae bacterium TaxID=298394 RepID=A0A6S6SS38_9GAMM|nr:MAG: Unknown protein [uncultured Thiotrichaceae bacterium]
MRTREIREMIKSRYREMAEEQTRDYYLTHDYYNGRTLQRPYQPYVAEPNPEEEIAKRDHAYLNDLLSPKPTLGNAFAEALAGFNGKTDDSDLRCSDSTLKPAEDLLVRIIEWHERYTCEGIAALLKEDEERLSTANIDALQNAYPNEPVIVQNIIIFAAFWLRSPRSYKANNEASMLDHVFAHYPTPALLRKCWKESATPENVQWLMIYFAYTQGTSLKALTQYFGWKTESPKLWHFLPESRGHFSPKEAVLYQEVMRLGGSEDFYEILMDHPSYQPDVLSSNEQSRNFWYSVVRWFIKHDEDVVGTEITRILTWARHQYTEFMRERKAFTMNGRSLSKVIRSANDYHRAVLAHQAELARRAEARRVAAIERAEQQRQEDVERRERAYTYYDDEHENYTWKKHNWDKQYHSHKGVWTFRELVSSQELNLEANIMEHCVYDYDYGCYMGESAIVSLRLDDERCITIELEPTSGDLIQAMGQYNRDPEKDELDVIRKWHIEVVKCKTRPRKRPLP